MSSNSGGSEERDFSEEFVDEYYIRTESEGEVFRPPRTYVEALILGAWFWGFLAAAVVVRVVWWVGEKLVWVGGQC